MHHGSEVMLNKMVYKHGAVAASVRFTNATSEKLSSYNKKNMFNGCTSADITDGENGPAIGVVDYGRQEGMDYWLIGGEIRGIKSSDVVWVPVKLAKPLLL